jgi:branched-chain amino acid transport system permease protein
MFYLLQYYLAALGSWYLIFLGALAILLMLFAPSGVWGVVSQSFDISLFPVRRRLIAPDAGASDAKQAA